MERDGKRSYQSSSAATGFVIAVLRSAGAFRRRLEAHCADQGLTYQQFGVLLILQEAKTNGEGPLPTMQVAERMLEPEPGITRMMDRLERKGFVRRERSKQDARVSLCRLSRKGQATLQRLEEPMNELCESIAKSIPKTKLQEVSELLESASRTDLPSKP